VIFVATSNAVVVHGAIMAARRAESNMAGMTIFQQFLPQKIFEVVYLYAADN
jgi:hypothetical protein